jgi:hypothetical protein
MCSSRRDFPQKIGDGNGIDIAVDELETDAPDESVERFSAVLLGVRLWFVHNQYPFLVLSIPRHRFSAPPLFLP